MNGEDTVESLQDVLRQNGFVRCWMPACNCGSWHQRYGWPERMTEIREALEEAGHPPSNDNGNLTINALRQLIGERDALIRTLAECLWVATGRG